MSAIISAQELKKEYRIRKAYGGFWGPLKTLVSPQFDTRKAVDGISFEIGYGELVGYLGPNGAGKSTTIKMITGILCPTSGVIRVNGMDPFEKRQVLMRRVGTVFGQRSQLWWDLPVLDSFNLLRRIYAVPKVKYRESLEYLTSKLDLEPLLVTPVRQLSLGQRMLCEITASLLHGPDILLLDEPTIGLDVIAKKRIRSIIKSINHERGTTVILCTHDLADIETICSRLIIIDKGKLIYSGSQEDVHQRYGKTRVLEVEFLHTVPPLTFTKAKVIRSSGKKAWIEFDKDQLSASALIEEITHQHDILDLAIHETGIETIIAGIYGGEH
ncbi:MAG: ABC transporter ATP-binding protein [Bacillota bacterium]